ncbi:MAG: NAD-dependent DNA ligase LigA [Alphaproteobacteria bacterium]|jgi:DNA ligase (NAD+)|nr:NAD-dependent DNA ligase LigA [Alphaproteobacteria bacterium]
MDFTDGPPERFTPIDKLSKSDARAEVEALRDAIAHHDHLYYVENAPEISDAAYDRLFHRLEELEERFAELRSPNSPTRRVGTAPLAELAEVRHLAPMLSLNAVSDADEVAGFLDRLEDEARELVLEPKFDGLSVELVYEDGRFRRGATRGDGTSGEDVTANLRTIGALPLELRGDDTPERVAVRGEVLLARSDFQALNKARVERGEEPFANPRNAAAGTVRRLESKAVARVPLDLVAYEILALDGERGETHWADLERLAAWGFKTDPHNTRARDLDAIADFHRWLRDQRDDLDWEIDGVVLKVDDLEARERLGTRARSPRWALAWKFPPREEVTTLEDIVVQVGTSGILTPVALLAPVDVGGVTVSRATLHNEGEVRRKDVRVGDKVRIARAGDVIPEVVERVKQPGVERGEPFAMPQRCPSCGTEVVREGAHVRCPAGLACPAQLRGRLVHYGSRDALDIEGLGERTAAQLVDRGFVADLADLYALGMADLEGLEGFGRTSAKALVDAIQGAKAPPLDRFLHALAIRHVGRRVARLLAGAFETLDTLRGASVAELEAIEDIGPATAASVHEFLNDPSNRDVLERMAAAGVHPVPLDREAAGPLDGLSFVFTGALADFSRDEARAEVERRGGRVTESVSGRTDYVVVGADPGATRDQAEAEGVRIVDEEGFKRLLAGETP